MYKDEIFDFSPIDNVDNVEQKGDIGIFSMSFLVN